MKTKINSSVLATIALAMGSGWMPPTTLTPPSPPRPKTPEELELDAVKLAKAEEKRLRRAAKRSASEGTPT